MKKQRLGWKYPALLAASAVVAVIGFSTSADAQEVKVTLSGKEEVPPVTTSASGSGTISVKEDKTVSGSVSTTGIKGTMAHIHSAPCHAHRSALGLLLMLTERQALLHTDVIRF